MDIVTNILKIVSTVVIAGGSLTAAWGGITLGGGLKNHTGPEIQNGMWGLAGGAVIILVGAFIATISFG